MFRVLDFLGVMELTNERQSEVLFLRMRVVMTMAAEMTSVRRSRAKEQKERRKMDRDPSRKKRFPTM